ncbi:MAG: AMP-binding protein [Nitrososphaeria archaeon]
MPRKELEQLQLKKLKATIAKVYDSIPFYRKRLDSLRLKPSDIRSLKDVQKLPFTTKDDLRANYPFGLSTLPAKDLAIIHTTTGTTGVPVPIPNSILDIQSWSRQIARCLTAAGITKGDVFQITPAFGLFTGGFGFYYGAKLLGVAVVPTGTGSTRRQIQLMLDFGVTSVVAISSYWLRLAEVALEMGVDPAKDTYVRKGIAGSEMWTYEMRERITKIWDADIHNVYGISELCGPGVGVDCHVHRGIHLFEDNYLVEVIDPKTGEVLEPEEEGELVFTTLERDAMPLLRYRSRDLTFMFDTYDCDCGRTFCRVEWIKGRSDDMLKISGVNVWPSEVENVLLHHKELGPEYQLVVSKIGPLDHLKVVIETKERLSEDEVKKKSQEIVRELQEVLLITPEVELVKQGALPRDETRKAKRVVDMR